jgi:hypothetical protein
MNSKSHLIYLTALFTLMLAICSNPAISHSESVLKPTAINMDTIANSIDAGHGLIFEVLKKGSFQHSPNKASCINVMDKGVKIATIEASCNDLACDLLEFKGVPYWIITAPQGSCGSVAEYIYFLSRPHPQQPIKLLGNLLAAWGSSQLLNSNGNLIVTIADVRFNYFHTCGATSSYLFFPAFYTINPSGLMPCNYKFKDKYLEGVDEHEQDIKKELSKNREYFVVTGGKCGSPTLKKAANKNEKPPAFMAGDLIADNLGLLITGRTICYLAAGETDKAWATMQRDIKKYYRSSNGYNQLRAEITAKMNKKPSYTKLGTIMQ